MPEPGHVAPVRVSLDGPLVETRFVERPNRFLLRCEIPDEAREEAVQAALGAGLDPAGLKDPVQPVHMADPGRLRELLIPGKRVWVRWAGSPTRKTRWSAALVESPNGQGLVSLDTTMPNALIHEALRRDALPEFTAWSLETAEWSHGRSRFDFLLSSAEGSPLVLEVKSVTLVEDDGIARFPDAVTTRGARHVRELAELARSGDWEAGVLFVLQRDDARAIEAARSIDPGFAAALAEAREAGVRVLGRRCRVTKEALILGSPVEVL